MSKQTVYLHIGMNKTGTSAIQRFFASKRNALKMLGVLYPETGCSGPAHYKLSQVLGFAHGKPRSKSELEHERLTLQKKFHKEVRSCKPDDILLSSEFFVIPKDIAPVKEFFAPLDVRILVYLRRHDAWWQSAYAQSVKTVANPPWDSGVESFVQYQKKKNKGKYRELLERWAAVFGKENIIVRPYESEQNQPDLLTDLFHAIGRDDVVAKMVGQPQWFNEGLPAKRLMLMDLYQRLDVDVNVRKRLIEHARTVPDDADRVPLISPAVQRTLVDENASDYEYIAREYLGREDGRLFYASLPDPDGPWEPVKPLSIIEAVEETVRALTARTDNKYKK